MKNLWTATITSFTRAAKDLARGTAEVEFVHLENGSSEKVTYNDVGNRTELYGKIKDRLGQLNAVDQMIEVTPIGEIRDLETPVVSGDIEAAKPVNAEITAWRAAVGKLSAMQSLVRAKALPADHPDLLEQERLTQGLFKPEFLDG